MYEIFYVDKDNDYEAYEQRDQYFSIGYVKTFEEAVDICKNKECFDFEQCKVYDSVEQFNKENLIYKYSLDLTINLKDNDFQYDTYVYPEYKEEVFHLPKLTSSAILTYHNLLVINFRFHSQENKEFIKSNTAEFVYKNMMNANENFRKEKISDAMITAMTSDIINFYKLDVLDIR